MATFPQTSIAAAPRESAWGITEERIRAKVDELVRAYHPLRIIAFGSWARGEARSDSDLDLAVILDEASRVVPESAVAPRIEMSVDVLVEERERHQRWAFAIASVHHDIATQGIVLYDREEGRGTTPFYATPSQEDLLSIKSESIAALMKIAGRDENTLHLDANDVETRAYHGQQALEKLMKVWLAAADIVPTRTHILEDLAAELQKNGLTLPVLPVNLKAVTEYATTWRYFPVPDSDKLDLGPLQQAVRLLREHVLQELATRKIQIKRP